MANDTISLDRQTLQTIYTQLQPVARGQLGDGDCSAEERAAIIRTGVDLFLTEADVARWHGVAPGFTHQGRWFGSLPSLQAVYKAAVVADRADGVLDGVITPPMTDVAVTLSDTAATNWQELLRPYLSSIFAIGLVTTESEREHGTAWIIEREALPAGRFLYWVITNAHVADDEGVEIRGYYLATPTDKGIRREKIRFHGLDYAHDIAVFSFESTHQMTPLRTAPDAVVRTGDRVLVVGNQLANGIVQTEGKVNAVDKYANDWFLPMIQDDSSALPGNSGSPTFNADGLVIGVCNSGAESGENYNIPIRYVLESYAKIRNTGSVTYGNLALKTTDMTEGTLVAEGIPQVANGLFVQWVYAQGLAAQDGVRAGDIIVAYDDVPIQSKQEVGRFWDTIRQRAPGSTVLLTIYRAGVRHQLPVRIDSQTERKPEWTHTEYGFELRPIDPIIDAQAGFPVDQGRLMLTMCFQHQGQSRRCDDHGILSKVNRTAVASIAEFLQATRAATSDFLVFHVLVPKGMGVHEELLIKSNSHRLVK